MPTGISKLRRRYCGLARRSLGAGGPMLLLALLAGSASAATLNWKANTTGDWFDAVNWDEAVAPTNGDIVFITNSAAWVILSNSTYTLADLTLGRVGNTTNTLIFTNWGTYLSATNVSILSNGSMTCAGAFTNNTMSNRVYVICSNITLAAGGSMTVNAKGYSGGAIGNNGHGPGAGKYGTTTFRGSGAGYGGIGGRTTDFGYGGLPYGTVSAPDAPGSGGAGSSAYAGGAGGGAIRIQAGGVVTNNGTISANGDAAVNVHAGGGSGGGVWIECIALAGSGTINANGGLGTGEGGCGAGGRIAVAYNLSAQGAAGPPAMQIRALPGLSGNYNGDLGTLYCPDTVLLSETFNTIQAQVWGVTNWAPASLTVSNVWVRFPEDGFRLTVTGDLNVVGTTGRLDLGGTTFNTFNIYTPANLCGATNGPSLDVNGNLTLTNGGSLAVYAAITNAANPDYGAWINVRSNLTIAYNSWVYPYSHNTNGGSPFFQVKNLIVAGTNGGFNANGKGFSNGARQQNGWGPGGGPQGTTGNGGGGGYGGRGGVSGQSGGGTTYGSSNAPMDAGSGGGGFNADGDFSGRAGGLIRVFADETITINTNGILSANGAYSATGGGAAGGGIYLRCKTINGATNAILRANGANGNPNNGSGGGGRIAVWRMYHNFNSTNVSVTGGTGYSTGGTNGTVVFVNIPVPGTIFTGH
ncbi:MAG: hypothetical protein HYV35_00300 [Lentisphaerae bacterium]|nr:hypothetical protein [Lentisphaerota bacterium]